MTELTIRRLRGGHSQRQVIARLHKALATAQRQRPLRTEPSTAVAGLGEPGWVGYERAVMHAAVNQARAELGAAPVGMEEVARAERLALGHIDYTAKFVLRCSELVTSSGSPGDGEGRYREAANG